MSQEIAEELLTVSEGRVSGVYRKCGCFQI